MNLHILSQNLSYSKLKGKNGAFLKKKEKIFNWLGTHLSLPLLNKSVRMHASPCLKTPEIDPEMSFFSEKKIVSCDACGECRI